MCHFLEEIRSVYYSKDQVKLFPAGYTIRELMVYLKHKSLAVLPDEMAQCCIVKIIVGWIKQVSIGTAHS